MRFYHRILLYTSLLPLFVHAGPLQRVANTTLQMPSSPPVFGFTSSNALGNLTFNYPVCIASPPGETNRLFVLEKTGSIIVITNLAAPTRTVFLNLGGVIQSAASVADERGLLGLAFHPGYATNGYFYVWYTGTATTSASGLHDILARYQVSANPNQGDAASELRLLVQYDEAGNHNGGDLHFGPDGYLYVSLGDEGGAEGEYQNTQRINKDFFSGMLRIDVDKRPGNLTPNPHPSSTANYLVPADNPFVGATSFNGLAVTPGAVRTEFWAVGLRNPWRYSFDPADGTIYCGDVGQGTREEVDLITKGANYGWNYWEGTLQRTNSAQIPAGFVHTPPLIDYSHSVGFCIIGGVVYHGSRWSQIDGAYIYGDYGSGRLWALWHSGNTVSQNLPLFTDAGVTAFGIDPSNGDVLYANQRSGNNGTINRIVYNASQSGAPLPATLAATGAFADTTNLIAAAGIVPFDINVPFWSDNALKRRWFSVPNPSLTIAFNPTSSWSFPTGAVWIKHFDLELTNGVASSRKRLETRLLVKNSGGVYGVTYRWGGSLTDAALVPVDGLDESFLINDGGTLRTQVWHYPGRQECLTCHSATAGYALGFNTPQLNHDFNYSGTVTNEISALSDAGYFSSTVDDVSPLIALAAATNTEMSLEYRVRSYLSANCVQCHQPGGVAQALWDARITTPMTSAGIIDGALLNNGGDANNRVIKPGLPVNSMLLTRISTRGTGQMPPLASSVLDAQAIALVTAWVTNHPPAPSGLTAH